MRKNTNGPLPALAVGIVVVAALATVMVEGGWVLWIPALLALAVVVQIWKALNR